MDKKIAVETVQTVWQYLAGLGQETSQHTSRAKEILDQIRSESSRLSGREMRLLVEEAAGLMKTVQENDAAQRTPHGKQKKRTR